MESYKQGTERFKLVTNLTITKEVWRHTGRVHDDGTIDGYWEAPNGYNERLTVSDDTVLGTLDFMGVMKVLGELHETIKKIPQS